MVSFRKTFAIIKSCITFTISITQFQFNMYYQARKYIQNRYKNCQYTQPRVFAQSNWFKMDQLSIHIHDRIRNAENLVFAIPAWSSIHEVKLIENQWIMQLFLCIVYTFIIEETLKLLLNVETVQSDEWICYVAELIYTCDRLQIFSMY